MKYNIENDIVIANFMGWKIDDSFPDKGKVWRSTGKSIELETTFKFNKSWDLLMPVVEKCLCSSESESREFDKHYDSIHDSLWSLNIDSTYNSVVEFIKWYNTLEI